MESDAGEGKREVHGFKLFAPPLRPDAVKRSAVIARIFPPMAPRVALLQAPAGYGKTMTLQQIKAACEDRGMRTAWLTFDDADNDIRRFLTHFEALLALARGDASPASAIAKGIEEEAGFGFRSDWAIDRLLALGNPVALFLDDFQVLRDPAILGFFLDFLERVPQSARIFIGSRSTPDIGLARLLVNEQCLVFRPEELRFSPDEAEAFFSEMRQAGLTGDEVRRIYALTEGWPAALQLYRLSMMAPAVRRSLGDHSSTRPRELAEYLADNVLALQSPDIQDFLLRTSLLTRLSEPLCNAVTGRTNSREILLWLEKAGLFVRSLDLQKHWFEYHALFASLLNEHQHERSDEVVLDVHSHAAQWYLQEGDYEATMHHAIACGDYGLAADTLEIWSGRLVAGALLMTMERWCNRLPFEEIARRPNLLIKNAYALAFLQRGEKLGPILALLKRQRPPFDIAATTDPTIVLSMAAIARDDIKEAFRIVEGIAIRSRPPGTFAAFELGAAANLMAYRQLAHSDFDGARDSLATALAQGARADASFSRSYTLAVAGVNLMMQGELRHALARCEAGMTEQRMHVDRSHASAALASCYFWCLYEANDLEKAEAVYGQSHDIIAASALLDFQAIALLPMARIHDARGEALLASRILDEAEAIGHANDWRRYLRIISWERVRRALHGGEFERAAALAAATSRGISEPSENWILFSEDIEGESLGRIRLAIHSGNFDLAKARLQHEFGRHRTRVYRHIKLHLLDAALHFRMGTRNAAQRCLRKAIRLGASQRYIRCFLDEGSEVIEMLRDERRSLITSVGRDMQDGIERAFVDCTLRASGAAFDELPAAPTYPNLREPLTHQERRILVFLANGVSNRDMAERLFVSENTVKFHLKHIYSKLAVTSRLQAITVARALGLIG